MLRQFKSTYARFGKFSTGYFWLDHVRWSYTSLCRVRSV